MKIFYIILAVLIFINPAYEQCSCSAGIGASQGDEPFLIVKFSQSKDTLILCGFVHKKLNPQKIIASEFEVIPCSLNKYILQFSALDICRVESLTDTLRITKVKNLPFDENWKWKYFDYKQFDISYKNNTYNIDTTFVFQAPPMNSDDLIDLKEFYISNKDNYDSFEKLNFLILGAALNGDDYFKKLLFSIDNEINLDGAYAEYYSEALKIYREYMSLK